MSDSEITRDKAETWRTIERLNREIREGKNVERNRAVLEMLVEALLDLETEEP